MNEKKKKRKSIPLSFFPFSKAEKQHSAQIPYDGQTYDLSLVDSKSTKGFREGQILPASRTLPSPNPKLASCTDSGRTEMSTVDLFGLDLFLVKKVTQKENQMGI